LDDSMTPLDIQPGKLPILLKGAYKLDAAEDPDSIYMILAENISNAIDSPCAVFLLDNAMLRGKAAFSGDEKIMAEALSPAGAMAEAIVSRKSICPTIVDSGLPPWLIDKYGLRSVMLTPIVYKDTVFGIVLSYSKDRQHFPEGASHISSLMACHAGRALENLKLVQRIQRCDNELRRIYEIQGRITRSMDLDKAMESIIENAPYITRLQYCMLYLLEPGSRNIISVKAAEEVEKKFGTLHFRLDDLIASKIAIDQRKPLFIEDAPNFKNIAQFIVKMLGMRSTIVLPLIARDRVIGVMWLYSMDRKLSFDEEDRRSAIALSDQAAIIIDNARIFRELEESYEKLKDLDKTKMEFFTLISHELRNPLAVIKGFTELLYDGTLGPVNDLQKDKLKKIRENVDKLADMVGKMSEISSLETQPYQVNKKLVSLEELVSELADTMSFLFKNKRIDVKVDIPSSLPLVEVDRKKLEQVLVNLLNNALKYTPEGGQIIISASDMDADILVSIHDTGIGIPKKDLDKIFSGFYHSGYKLSYEYKGPGLGLAISRKIIEGHGGRIWADSETGKGSTFFFTIPKHVKAMEVPDSTVANVR